MRPEETRHPEIPWLNPDFLTNYYQQLPDEMLDRYAGQYVAWNWDGTRILADAATREALDRQLTDAGINLQRVVFDYVNPPGMGLIS